MTVTVTHQQVADRTGIAIPPHLVAQAEVPVRDQLRDQLRQLVGQLGDQLGGQLRQLVDQLDDQLVGQLYSQLHDQLHDQLDGQLVGQLDDQLVGQLVGQLYSQLRGQLGGVHWSWWRQAWCTHWLHVATMPGITPPDADTLTLAAAYQALTVPVLTVPLRGVLIAVGLHTVLHRDTQQRLHCTTGPA